MSHRILKSFVPALALVLFSVPAWAQPSAAASDDDDDAVAEASVATPSSTVSAAAGPTVKAAAPAVQPVAAADPTPPPASTTGEYGSHGECKHLVAGTGGWTVGVCGFVALNAIHDSTQGLGAGLNNSIIARPGTYAGDHDQMQFTARDSRVNVEAIAPATHGVTASGLIQFDFTGVMPSDATEGDQYIFGTPRLRLAVMKLNTPVVNMLAGQYHDLFGWGGTGFFPATVGFLGVPGEIYHRNPQVRLTKTLHSNAIDFEVALAAVRPAQRAAGVPDGEGGLRLAVNRWTGASAQAYGQPSIGPAQFGVSGVARRFKPVDFVANAGDSNSSYGWGFAANAVIPVIPRSDNEDRSNGLTITAEFSTGTGIADLYTGLTGGLLFPTLPNDKGASQPIYYVPNIDNGILTYDANGAVKTAKWQAIVIGLQYYLPIAQGRVWISGIYSQSKSNNLVSLTTIPDRGLVYYKSEYEDVSLFGAVTDAVQLSASFQTVRQLFGDRTSARNNRVEFGSHFFF